MQMQMQILGEIARQTRLKRKAELATRLADATRLAELANKCHTPAGSPQGGQFCERIASPRPTSVKEGAAHIPGEGARMSPDLIGKTQVASTIARQAKVPGFEDFKGRTSRKTFDEIIDRQAETITDSVDEALAISTAGAKLHAEWYPRANQHLGDLAKTTKLNKNSVMAAAAALSPGADWADNLAWTQRVAERVSNEKNTTITTQQAQAYYFERLAVYEKSVKKASPEKPFTGKEPQYPGHIVGKKLADLSDQDAAIALRGEHDQAGGGPLAVRQLGGQAGFGDPKNRAIPQTDENLAKAVSILRNPTAANVDSRLGNAPKVRSFYNNLREPRDTEFEEVTVDTHHFGLANGHPWGASSPFVQSGSSSISSAPKTAATGAQGTYPLIVEATRRATARVNAKYGTDYTPNQIQSVVWELHRAKFPSKSRSQKMQAAISAIRTRRARGEITKTEETALVESARIANKGPSIDSIRKKYEADAKLGSGG